MNPTQALENDWGMYYNGTFMKYDGVLMQVACGGFDHEREVYRQGLHGRTGPRTVYKQLDPALLECWWPRAGAYNIGRAAVYIGRQAYRNMKKSARMPDHYRIMWGDQRLRDKCLWTMAKGPNPIEYRTAIREVMNGERQAAAITADLILFRDGRNVQVVCRGEPAGTLKGRIFTPLFAGTPAAKRTLIKLQKEGIPCI
jgi:hypothetical protein